MCNSVTIRYKVGLIAVTNWSEMTQKLLGAIANVQEKKDRAEV